MGNIRLGQKIKKLFEIALKEKNLEVIELLLYRNFKPEGNQVKAISENKKTDNKEADIEIKIEKEDEENVPKNIINM